MFVKNKYLDAVFKSILCFALFHIALLIIYAIINKDIVILNLYNILDIDLFLPGVEQGTFSQVMSVIGLAAVYLIVLFSDKKTKKSKK